MSEKIAKLDLCINKLQKMQKDLEENQYNELEENLMQKK
jgi:hypothetical protein